MLVIAIRTLIIYLLIVLAVRLMGKRQIGQLRPTELVVALIISDIAAVPMQDNGIPLVYGIFPIFLLVALELILSALMLKFPFMERLVSGNPVVIIQNGKLNKDALKKLRLTVDDLLEAMRMQDCFQIQDVECAVAETNGHISLFLRPEARTVTCKDLNLSSADTGMPVLVVSDGEFSPFGLSAAGENEQSIKNLLLSQKISLQSVFLMTMTPKGMFFILSRDGKTLQGVKKP
jgi:uncharacterized membrane protein YcaP (DUF421 family)